MPGSAAAQQLVATLCSCCQRVQAVHHGMAASEKEARQADKACGPKPPSNRAGLDVAWPRLTAGHHLTAGLQPRRTGSPLHGRCLLLPGFGSRPLCMTVLFCRPDEDCVGGWNGAVGFLALCRPLYLTVYTERPMKSLLNSAAHNRGCCHLYDPAGASLSGSV